MLRNTCLVELLEQARQLLGVNPNTRVTHAKLYLLAISPSEEGHLPSFSELARIREQIEKDLPYAHRVEYSSV